MGKHLNVRQLYVFDRILVRLQNWHTTPERIVRTHGMRHQERRRDLPNNLDFGIAPAQSPLPALKRHLYAGGYCPVIREHQCDVMA
jgi:hypothetical protein